MKLHKTIPLLIASTVITFSVSCKKKSMHTEHDETQADKKEAIQAAFTSEDDFSETGSEKKIAEKILKQLGQALLDKDQDEIKKIYSANILGSYCIDKFDSSMSSGKKKAMLRGFTGSFGKTMINQSAYFRFDETEIRRIEKLSDKEFICYTKQWDNEMQTYTNSRWWFILDEADGASKWVIYDSEDIGGGMRMSNLITLSLTALHNKKVWTQSLIKLSQLFQNTANPEEIDFEKLSELSKNIADSDAPEEIKSLAVVMYASSLFASGKYEESIKSADTQLAKTSDAYILYFTQSMCYKELEKYDEAIQAMETYSKYMGIDSETYMELADIYYLKEDYKKSKELSLLGINMNPLHSECLASYAVLTDKDEWLTLPERIKATGKELDSYELIMDYAISLEKNELAQWLFEKFKTKFPQEDELIEYYEETFKLPQDAQEKDEEE